MAPAEGVPYIQTITKPRAQFVQRGCLQERKREI